MMLSNEERDCFGCGKGCGGEERRGGKRDRKDKKRNRIVGGKSTR